LLVVLALVQAHEKEAVARGERRGTVDDSGGGGVIGTEEGAEGTETSAERRTPGQRDKSELAGRVCTEA
jgi:hypothetical protein